MQKKSKLRTAFQFVIGLLVVSVPILVYINFFKTSQLQNENKVLEQAYYFMIKEDVVFELNQPIKPEEIIDTNYVVLSYPTIDTTKIGKQVLKFIVSGQQIENIEKEIEVVDSQKPKIKLLKSNVEIMQGESLDVETLFKVEDGQTYTTHVSEYNTNQVGNQSVVIKAIDASGNEAEATLTLIVKEKEKEMISNTRDTQPVIPNPPPQSSNNGSRVSDSTSIPKPKINLNPKYYLYKDGYNRITGFATCKQENNIEVNGGGCLLYYDESGKEIGYWYKP